MVQIQSSLIKQIKIGRPEHWLIPHPLRPVTSHFYLNTLQPASEWTSNVYHS